MSNQQPKPRIVPVSAIPKLEQIIDVPLNDLKAVYKLCDQMRNIVLAEHGAGLSALQIGIPWRLFVAIKDARDHSKFRYFVNCSYTPVGEEKVSSIEGCLSLQNFGEFRRFKVKRFSKIRLIGQQLKTEDRLKLLDIDEIHEGELAIVYQHEIDHSAGILISQIGEEIYIL